MLNKIVDHKRHRGRERFLYSFLINARKLQYSRRYEEMDAQGLSNYSLSISHVYEVGVGVRMRSPISNTDCNDGIEGLKQLH